MGGPVTPARGLSEFVPQGLNEGSDSTKLAEVQAIYCLVTVLCPEGTTGLSLGF
jgi:hypothetical protein